MTDQQAFYADCLAFEHHLDEIMLAAASRPLTADEIKELRAALGIPERKAKTVPLPPSFIAAFDPYSLPF